MYAIIATGGKQYKVSEGDIITIEKLGKEVSEWESLSAQLNTGTKKKRKKKDDFVDGSTATTDTEANVQFNNVNETFNPYGE